MFIWSGKSLGGVTTRITVRTVAVGAGTLPVSGALVGFIATATNQLASWGYAGIDGSFTTSVPEGEYRVKAGCNRVGWLEKTIRAGGSYNYVIPITDLSCRRCDTLCAHSPLPPRRPNEEPPGDPAAPVPTEECREGFDSLMECSSDFLLTGRVSECCRVPLLVAGILAAGVLTLILKD